jgi:hypothetical protein
MVVAAAIIALPKVPIAGLRFKKWRRTSPAIHPSFAKKSHFISQKQTFQV